MGRVSKPTLSIEVLATFAKTSSPARPSGRAAPLLASLLIALLPTISLAEDLRIGHLTLVTDPRYVQDWGYARLITPPPVQTEQALSMAIEDLAFVTEASGLSVIADHREVTEGDLVATARAMVADGDVSIILDLPAKEVETLASALEASDVTLFNATAPDTSLRMACHPNLLHSGPSLRMEMDAFAQYLRAMDWLQVLVLVGEHPDDAGLAAAFEESAARLRLEIVETRPFTLAASPDQREGNNVKLLTSGVDYDVVFVADSRGEFGRYIPYSTQLPRPVIGSIGLTSEAWHWAMERDGATQVTSRFDAASDGRKMSSEDWSVWIAAKSLITAASKLPGATVTERRDFMKSDRLKLDGSKGVTLNYRSWDGQLRMPVLLSTNDAVIAIAPIEGFLHATNTLDTLGTDQPEFACQ
jgi:ABC transporter substrate binding protein (PQQ-dependent alcohol dehydrogenase system)